MSIDSYIFECSESLLGLPGVHRVQRFGGQFSDDDLKALNLSNSGCLVLLTGIGGPLERNPMGELDCDASFGAFVIASADRDTIGHSKKAAEVATEIARHIDEHSRDWAGASRTKDVEMLELSERDNPLTSGTRYGIWQVFWSQRIVLHASKQ